MALVHEGVTQSIIGAAFEVYRNLGYGSLEKVYQKALQVELSKQGLHADIEHPIKVRYKGIIVKGGIQETYIFQSFRVQSALIRG